MAKKKPATNSSPIQPGSSKPKKRNKPNKKPTPTFSY